MRIEFGRRWVGDGLPVYVIAEAGSNHNGSFDQALRLIDIAADAGADAVKFQTFKASRMYSRGAGESDYLRVPKSIYRIIEDMEMPEAWIPQLAQHCAEHQIEFMSTPFDEQSADLLAPHVSVFKIASYEMSHTPLLRHVAQFGKPMVVSTGAHEMHEIAAAAAAVRECGNERLVLLQCTAKYPAPLGAINVRAMGGLREATGCLVGLSDHSRDPLVAPLVATALGAALIEKHFTISNTLPGPDHQFAVEPHELQALIAGVRAAEQVLGDGGKRVLEDEQELHAFARRSIFTTRAIEAGERISTENVAVLRCGKLGYGLPPADLPQVLGRTAARRLPAETPVVTKDLV